jgi:hypothetical protein
MAKTRVTDGVRTRDNRNHNPPRKKRYRALGLVWWALTGADKRGLARVSVPGPRTSPESEDDVFAALRRVAS